MAIKIPILTSFDPKGLRQANASFANLQGSVRSLGANFAVAGAAIAAVGVVIAKNVESLARIETINAQTAQTISSMGNAANITATEVEALAGRLEGLTAIEAESIQEGANLLLTFGNIRDELGAGNDIFSQTTAIMVDMGVALRKGPVDTATMLGKALNDPIQGLTALRRVGVSFTEQQIAQVKALQESGDLMGAQKLILAELQNQYGGSGAAFAETFTGQLQLMGHELGTIGEEATMAVMPALQSMVEQLRELIPVIGPQLKEAIESVDWAGLVTAVVNLATYFAQNAEAIIITAGALWSLSTMIKTVTTVVALSKLVIDLYAWYMGKLAVSTGVATVALKAFRTALITTGVGGILVGLGFLADFMLNTADATDVATDSLGSFNDSIPKEFQRPMNPPQFKMPEIPEMPTFGGTQAASATRNPDPMGIQAWLTKAQEEANIAAKRIELIGAGLSSAVADSILSSTDAMGAANDALFLIATGGLANINALTDAFNKSAAGQAFAAEQARKIAEEAERVAQESQRAAQEAAQREQEILDKRMNAFESFNDSVKNIFGQIKDSILSSFDLPSLGNSVNSITRNIAKLLERTKNFATNISKLSGMGLNSALLQQVIQAGPMAGSALAQALVGGGGAFVSQLNQAYGEFGDIASGIAGVGTRSQFDNAQVVNTYNIEVNGGVGSGPSIGKAIVDAIKSYERTSGAVWQGA
jgi:hypothetical protein